MANASCVVLTPKGRGSFVNVIKAREYLEKGKPTGKFAFTSDLLFEPSDLDKFLVFDAQKNTMVEVKLPELLAKVAKEQWPDISLKETFSGAGKKGWPIKNGDDIAEKAKKKEKNAEQYRGKKVLSVKCNVSEKVQPPILSIAPTKKGEQARTLNRASDTDMQTAQSLFQGGNYFMAELNIVANEVSDVKYLTCYLNSLRYLGEGEKFGARGGAMMDRFAGVVGGESDYDPTSGASESDDEIPF